MNRPNPFASTNFFKPASQFLRSTSSATFATHRKSSSLDELDSDTEAGRRIVTMDGHDRSSYSAYQAGELTPKPIPLVDISRSPSPYPRSRSAVPSDDEDDYFGQAAQSKPLVSKDFSGTSKSRAKRIFQKGGIGHFLFGTAIGWRVYLSLLVSWVGGCQFGLLLMNRFIFWTGTYKSVKFPNPFHALR